MCGQICKPETLRNTNIAFRFWMWRSQGLWHDGLHLFMRDRNLWRVGVTKCALGRGVCACQVHRWTCPCVEIQVSMIIRPHATHQLNVQHNQEHRSIKNLKSHICMGQRVGQSHLLWYAQPEVNCQPSHCWGISEIKLLHARIAFLEHHVHKLCLMF